VGTLSHDFDEAAVRHLLIDLSSFRPFYSVISDDDSEAEISEPFTTESNYRTLMSEMMLSVRIENPRSLRNRTIGQHLAQIDWTDEDISRNVEVSSLDVFALEIDIAGQTFWANLTGIIITLL